MVTSDRVQVSRHISAEAHAIFVLVSDPVRHVQIDGTGMLQAAPDARPLTTIGQTFDIQMNRRPLGDIPNTEALHQLVLTVPDYQVRCTITQIVPDRLIEWTVRAVGKPPAGHVYGWQIESVSDDKSLVTNYYDWTNVSDDLRTRFRWPVVPVDGLEHSLENLDRLATS
jgi:hypothetical protein